MDNPCSILSSGYPKPRRYQLSLARRRAPHSAPQLLSSAMPCYLVHCLLIGVQRWISSLHPHQALAFAEGPGRARIADPNRWTDRRAARWTVSRQRPIEPRCLTCHTPERAVRAPGSLIMMIQLERGLARKEHQSAARRRGTADSRDIRDDSEPASSLLSDADQISAESCHPRCFTRCSCVRRSL